MVPTSGGRNPLKAYVGSCSVGDVPPTVNGLPSGTLLSCRTAFNSSAGFRKCDSYLCSYYLSILKSLDIIKHLLRVINDAFLEDRKYNPQKLACYNYQRLHLL